MKLKFLSAICAAALLCSQFTACAIAADDYSWASNEIAYCQKNGIMTGDQYGNLNPGGTLTRGEMAKMLCESFELTGDGSFTDTSGKWYEWYAATLKSYMKEPTNTFNGDEPVTREEFASTLMRAMGLTEGYIRNPGIIAANFKDSDEVSSKYRTLLSIAVERAYIKGSDGYLRPQDTLKRAEVCTLLYRAIESKNGNLTLTWKDLGVQLSYTPLISPTKTTVESAKAWAKAKGATDLFIAAADYYWYYGNLTGICPEILYAQAAKETAYGRYGGAVTPDMNNFAGIKTATATGDTREDHESFATQEDGVRAHFNHMSAYVGLAPIGEVHQRYYTVSSISWAGTVKYAEELGGKWCPDLYYGIAIIKDMVSQMYSY